MRVAVLYVVQGIVVTLVVNATIVDSKRSGLGNYSVNLVKELAALRDDIVIFTSHDTPFVQTNIRIRKSAWNLAPSTGLQGHLARILWTQTALGIHARRLGASCLFSLVPEVPLWNSGSQVVVVHDLIPILFPKEYPLQNLYFRWYISLALRRVSKIIAVSQHTKHDIVSYFGVNPSVVEVVSGGCDHQMFCSGINPDTVKQKYGLTSYILYVGNLHPHKNLARLIKAFHQLLPCCSHQLVIVGTKDPRFFPVLGSLVEKLELQHRVMFLDFVPQKDLPGLYSGAELFVFPSLYEGFGLPLVEAMACGVPVIAGTGGAIEEVVDKAGVTVDPTNVHEIAEAIQYLLENPKAKDTLRELGFHQAKKFSWDASAGLVSKILDESIN